MERVTVYLEKSQYERLKLRSLIEEQSLSTLVRKLVLRYIREHDVKTDLKTVEEKLGA